MKFDYIVGNPPYQEETEKASETNGQLRSKSIFQYFQTAADEISQKGTVLIYPAKRWIQRSGRGMKEFGLTQINDVRLSKIVYYPKAKDVFPTTDIGDGISIVVKNHTKKTPGFEYVFCDNGKEEVYNLPNPGENIMPLDPRHNKIVEKLDNFSAKYGLPPLHNRISYQKLFGIESDFVEKNPDKVKLLDEADKIDYNKQIKLYTNDRAGKGGRSRWYVVSKSCITASHNLINKWKVVVSSANAGGQKRDSQLAIFDNHSVFGRSRIALGVFDTEEEAQHFYMYMQTNFAKFAFLMTDENLGTLGMKVPDLMCYIKNDLVSFDENLDDQLCKLCEFTEAEYQYLVDVVTSHRK